MFEGFINSLVDAAAAGSSEKMYVTCHPSIVGDYTYCNVCHPKPGASGCQQHAQHCVWWWLLPTALATAQPSTCKKFVRDMTATIARIRQQPPTPTPTATATPTAQTHIWLKAICTVLPGHKGNFPLLKDVAGEVDVHSLAVVTTTTTEDNNSALCMTHFPTYRTNIHTREYQPLAEALALFFNHFAHADSGALSFSLWRGEEVLVMCDTLDQLARGRTSSSGGTSGIRSIRSIARSNPGAPAGRPAPAKKAMSASDRAARRARAIAAAMAAGKGAAAK